MSEYTKNLQIDTRRLVYLDQGTGPAVVLLHGAFAEAHEWDLQIPALCDAGYRALYPMRAGYGQSDPHADFASHYKDACDVRAILDELQVDRAVLVGHSAGAFVALQFYLGWPERVRAIVSVDSAAFGKLNCKGLGQQGYDTDTRALYEKNKDMLAQLGRAWDYPGDENVSRLANMTALRRRQPDLTARLVPKADPNERAVPAGEFCKVPLLVFTTGRGHIRPDEAPVEQLRERLPADNATLVPVVDSGHWIHRDLPEVFNAKLLEFLRTLKGNNNATTS